MRASRSDCRCFHSHAGPVLVYFTNKPEQNGLVRFSLIQEHAEPRYRVLFFLSCQTGIDTRETRQKGIFAGVYIRQFKITSHISFSVIKKPGSQPGTSHQSQPMSIPFGIPDSPYSPSKCCRLAVTSCYPVLISLIVSGMPDNCPPL